MKGTWKKLVRTGCEPSGCSLLEVAVANGHHSLSTQKSPLALRNNPLKGLQRQSGRMDRGSGHGGDILVRVEIRPVLTAQRLCCHSMHLVFRAHLETSSTGRL